MEWNGNFDSTNITTIVITLITATLFCCMQVLFGTNMLMVL